MGSDNVRLRIKVGEKEFEAEGPADFVEQMLAKFDPQKSTAAPSRSSSGTGTEGLGAGGKPQSVGEFVRLLGITKHTDLVLAFGYYLEKYKGQTDFTPADINACYYDTKREASNTSQAIIQNMRSGRLMQAKGEGGARAKYIVTSTGEQQVAGWIAAKPE